MKKINLSRYLAMGFVFLLVTAYLQNSNGQCKAKFKVEVFSNELKVSIKNQSAVGNQYYKWDFGNGDTLVEHEKRTFYYQYQIPGEYLIQLITTNENTGCKDTASHEVSFQDYGNPVFNYKIDESNDRHVEFSIPAKSLFTDFYWSFGDGKTSNLDEPVHEYVTGGKYKVTLTAISAESQKVKDFYREILIDSSSIEYCADFDYSIFPATNEIKFNNTSLGKSITGYWWDFGDKNYSNDPNPIHTYAEPGYYTVCLSVMGSDGTISETYCKEIGYNTPLVTRPRMLVQVNHEDLSIVSTLQFIEEVASLSWETGDGNYFDEEAELQHSYTSQHPYKLIVKGTTNGGYPFFDVKIIDFGKGNKPVVGFGYMLKDKLLKTNKKKVELQGAVSGDISRKKLYWDFGDGTSDSLSIQPVHEYYGEGKYNVCFSIVDPASKDTITTCDEIDLSSPTGMNIKNIRDGLKVFPNPARDKMEIIYESACHGFITITLHDLSGKKITTVASQKMSPGINYLKYNRDPELPSGLYLLVFSSKNQHVTKKVMLY
jgi:PKD repeat protein